MVLFGWISEHWFSLLQTIGIVAGLTFTGASFRAEARERRVQNLLELTKEHRAIWSEIHPKPELARILEKSPNIGRQPITREEERFVISLILHLSSAHRAIQEGSLTPIEGLEEDVRQFFSLPIPAILWSHTRHAHETAFVAFVETALSRGKRPSL